METKVRKVTPKRVAEIKKAQKDFNRIIEEVKPFIKKRQKPYESTAGQWKVVSYE